MESYPQMFTVIMEAPFSLDPVFATQAALDAQVSASNLHNRFKMAGMSYALQKRSITILEECRCFVKCRGGVGDSKCWWKMYKSLQKDNQPEAGKGKMQNQPGAEVGKGKMHSLTKTERKKTA